MARLLHHWWLTATLFAAYLLVFHLWIGQPAQVVLASCLGTTIVLAMLMRAGIKKKYFTDRIDGITHGTVVLDVLLEGTLIPTHDSHGFYFCAAAFAFVTIGYRAWKLSSAPRLSPEAT